MEKKTEKTGEKVVWVACRAEGADPGADKGCGGKEAVLMSHLKTGNQRAINLVRYRCISCGRVFSISY